MRFRWPWRRRRTLDAIKADALASAGRTQALTLLVEPACQDRIDDLRCALNREPGGVLSVALEALHVIARDGSRTFYVERDGDLVRAEIPVSQDRPAPMPEKS